jgi:small-conductance mechanosensitive channel
VLLGYVALSNYLLGNTILTLLMAGAMVALRFLSREAFWRLLSARGAKAQTVKMALALTDQGSRLIHSWILVGIDIVLVLSALVTGLIIWGIPPQDVSDWVGSLFQGFNIGSYHFSFADLLLAIGVFAGVILVTRLFQKFLEYRLLPNTRMDIGLRTAISSGVGYVGVAIAMLAAISVLGISLTGLAVVAGALSVGIGFGLQNIVNNFVSGIILLIERPVKIGDTIRVHDMEGIVKRIKVRSTEIETYQRASVIVPNAELLQSILFNLTHLDRTYRVEMPVGVGYSSDIDQVEALLLQCAKAHPRVLNEPEPLVLLQNFGDNALEFELRIYLGDLDDRVVVPSEIRKQIVNDFRKAGIEIPFPQRTVWIQPTGDSATADG